MDFNEFSTIIYGHKPFRWKAELATQLSLGKWAQNLELPPAFGKTSIIDVWAYSLIKQVESKSPRTMPLRLWFVVDLRQVVDQAYMAARLLAKALDDKPELAQYKKMLCEHFGVDKPLIIGTMRGGLDTHTKNEYLTVPNQPTIITSTVDQFGSRLLLRGYGCTLGQRPIHAAMAGIDSLIIVDEGHRSIPFCHTVEAVIATQKNILGNIPPTRIIKLTATHDNIGTVFSLNADDPELQKRLKANRPVTLHEVTKKANFLKLVVDPVKKMAKTPGVKAISVVCNTIDKARTVFEALQAKKYGCTVLIGRNRPQDRMKIVKQCRRFLVGRRNRAAEELFIVVSTQTIEAGSDYDFDCMVVEAAPLDNLIQRFGRQNRVGDFPGSLGAIILDNKEDFVYGEKSKETFEYLKSLGKLNFPIKSVPGLFGKSNYIAELTEPGIMQLAHTRPNVGTSVDRLLHGVSINSLADINIVYRSDIDYKMLKDEPKIAQAWVDLFHPKPHEIMAIPRSVIWRREGVADVSFDQDKVDKKNILANKLCVRYRPGKKSKVVFMKQLVDGDLAVVPEDFGLHDQYGYNPNSSELVKDIFDLPNCKHQMVLRLHPRHMPGLHYRKFIDVDNGGAIDFNALFHHIIDNIAPAMSDRRKSKRLLVWLNRILFVEPGWKFKHEFTPDKEGLMVLCYYKEPGSKVACELVPHSRKVEANVGKFSNAIGLDQRLAKILQIAAKYHDLGKADERFQTMLYGKVPDPTVILAKSIGHSGRMEPWGWRHELQSVAILLQNKDKLGLSDGDFDEVIYFIMTHHGWGRPYLPMVLDETFERFNVSEEGKIFESTETYLNILGPLGTDIFHAINEKYGVWGTAYLESVLRLADWTASR